MIISAIPEDRHIACCTTGRSLAETFLVMTRTAVPREQVITALADWAMHLVDDHDMYGLCFPACQACRAFAGVPQGGLDTALWSAEERVHHVVHALDVEMQAQQNKG